MAHFKNTYKPARFLFLDVRVGVVIFASLLHIRYWTLGLDVIVILLALYVERIGLGFVGSLRAVRAYFTGSYRPALRLQKIRRKVDFERRNLAWEKPVNREPVLLDEVRKNETSLLKGKL
ncbi:acetyltransferase [Rhizobium laguerreae]|uniref:IcmT/TraK family protein n=1 Tax=Rhizobium laguerreae TaxID=1076926 RepID=UPI001C915610|nr:IcmT/TraK family protein [Rhizobium laguerreae]MBY3155277.1 acetyltransferase [Rhizobium laguerreae]MBY3432675.1 acetyltransferase [Rhizobium laguerreae]